MLRTEYLRSAFQHADSNAVRVSLDTAVVLRKVGPGVWSKSA
jgi:SPX domain protein involved in polyphosphate accumulation